MRTSREARAQAARVAAELVRAGTDQALAQLGNERERHALRRALGEISRNLWGRWSRLERRRARRRMAR